MPVVRNRVLMLLSSKRPSEIESGPGKQQLVAELVATVREAVPGSAADRGASGALFSTFVIQ
jgi:flagellar FliL protein